MDAIVEAALRKWPNVPHCRGWLALDVRGDWYMRDERVQHAGAFPQVKGSRIEHALLIDFIGRNYLCDGDGAWFFQNGPQRVYVDLEAAPWVWRLAAAPASSGGAAAMAPAITSHTGRDVAFVSAHVDESGRLFLATDAGLGIAHTLDMEAAAAAVESGLWRPQAAVFADLPRRFGYRLINPAPAPASPGAG